MESWTIFGAGNFVADILDAIEANHGHVEFLVLNVDLENNIVSHFPGTTKVISIEDFEPRTDLYFFGFVNPNKEPLLKTLAEHNLDFANLIHPFSYVAKTAKLGQGNFIGAGCVIGAKVDIGDFNFVNRSASIGHHVHINNFNHFGPGSTISGGCVVGNKNLFGSGSILIDRVRIGDSTALAAGAVAVDDITNPGTYVGVPAKLLAK